MQIDQILLFEPDTVDNFYPFSVLHPVWEIRCGALRIFEKYQLEYPHAHMIFRGRDLHLKSFLNKFKLENFEVDASNLLVIDASIVPDEQLLETIEDIVDSKNKAIRFNYKGKPIAAFIPKSEFEQRPEYRNEKLLSDLNIDLLSSFEQIEISKVKKMDYLFHAISFNGEAIDEDAKYFDFAHSMGEEDYKGLNIVEDDKVYISETAKIAPGVVLDASEGPIIIDENVKIMPNSVIIGPCYIGKHSTIKVAAKIYENTSIGEHCKVGGELEATIIHAYSNKQHDGFLGHSYISEWVNFGADTNNSDLKNTYDHISIRLEGRDVKTGTMFLGLLCGDHTKTGINTMFTTGSVAGICGILVREWFLPCEIPSFTWGGHFTSPMYKVDKAIGTAKKVMSRRNREMNQYEEELLRAEYKKVQSRRT